MQLKPILPALESKVLTVWPPGKSLYFLARSNYWQLFEVAFAIVILET